MDNQNTAKKRSPEQFKSCEGASAGSGRTSPNAGGGVAGSACGHDFVTDGWTGGPGGCAKL